MKIFIRFQVRLSVLIIFWIDLINACRGPQRAIHLQAEEIGNSPPLTHKGLLPFRVLHQDRVIRVGEQVVFRDQSSDEGYYWQPAVR